MKKLLLFSFALLAFMACDLNKLADDIQDSLSSFDASVSGDVTSSFSGSAEFVNSYVQSQNPQGSNLLVNMDNSSDPDESLALTIVLTGVQNGVPTGTYTYDLNNPDVLITAAYTLNSDSFTVPDPTATNQIVITKVENTRVEGTFNLTLASLAGGKVTVTGSFKAIGIYQTI